MMLTKYDLLYYYPKRIRKFSVANMMTSVWGRFKGPPSALEWTFGSAGRRNAVQGQSGRRDVGVRAQHAAVPRFHTGSGANSVKL